MAGLCRSFFLVLALVMLSGGDFVTADCITGSNDACVDGGGGAKTSGNGGGTVCCNYQNGQNPPNGPGVPKLCCTSNTPSGNNPPTIACRNVNAIASGSFTLIGNNNPSECAAALGGDPVLRGFTGASCEFAGQPDTWYNLVSEATHNVNFHLTSANLTSKANGGTLIDAIGIVYNENTIEAALDTNGDLTVSINGNSLITKESLSHAPNHAFETKFDDQAEVAVELFRNQYGHSIRVTTPVLSTTVYVTPAGLDTYYQEYLPAYLNFAVALQDPLVEAIHGVLGQTAPLSRGRKAGDGSAISSTAIELCAIEGGEEAYNMSGPFETEYRFSQFGKATVPSQVLKIARRRLSEKDVPLFIATSIMGTSA